ncbi:hypothetical protein [Nocardioides dongxiaopingii]|uniref:hypothetical protein n=1 Tax=Nocardioides dongxiaopingii TaxID=2576036 RepID=UPI0010C761C9|nr:hypothetical protein [Nocardioides dongxiaopingii]
MSDDGRFWARHYQDDWQARAGDPRMPYWLRVASLAFGSHANNGHAKFKRGEIALILAKVDPGTGEVRPFANVRREIALAVEYGWLEEGSYWGCLIVPAHSIRKGDMYAKQAPCPLAKRHKERANRSPTERNRVLKSTTTERFSPRTAHSLSGSEREPISSDLSPVRQDRNHPNHDTTTRRSA